MAGAIALSIILAIVVILFICCLTVEDFAEVLLDILMIEMIMSMFDGW